MSAVEQFIEAYERQYDFWESLASKARILVEAEVTRSGMRAIVTSRAKSTDRLRAKVQQRNAKHPYATQEEIAQDIVDLAGVRVALYFPSQQHEVENIIDGIFSVATRKEFPDINRARPGSPRFTGYRAKHFRGSISPDRLPDTEKRYEGAPVEIQVASVLMHAWSEVEHDLVYKPIEGELSGTEYSLLDQLNGLVHSGEIALEELLLAREARIARDAAEFRDHFELAEFLRNQDTIREALVSESALGAIDVLFEFLGTEGINSAAALTPYIGQLDPDFEQRPLADQIVDLILAGNPAAYNSYKESVAKARRLSPEIQSLGKSSEFESIGEFVLAWSEFQSALFDFFQRHEPPRETGPRVVSSRRAIDLAYKLGTFTQAQHHELIRMSNVRNQIVHGRQTGLSYPIEAGLLKEFVATLTTLSRKLQ